MSDTLGYAVLKGKTESTCSKEEMATEYECVFGRCRRKLQKKKEREIVLHLIIHTDKVKVALFFFSHQKTQLSSIQALQVNTGRDGCSRDSPKGTHRTHSDQSILFCK